MERLRPAHVIYLVDIADRPIDFLSPDFMSSFVMFLPHKLRATLVRGIRAPFAFPSPLANGGRGITRHSVQYVYHI